MTTTINLGIRTESHITLVVLVLLYYLLVEGFLRFLWILTRKPIQDLTITKCFKKTLTILLGINLFNFMQFLIINKRSTTLYRIFDEKFFKLQMTRKPIRDLSQNLGYQYMYTYVLDYNILDF